MDIKDQKKGFHLEAEFKQSEKLILLGLKELQSIDYNNDFYFLPFRLLSDGVERYMKCIICYGFYELNNKFPSVRKIQTHDLKKLKEEIVKNYVLTKGSPILRNDYKYLKGDEYLGKLLSILATFGNNGRYYNLDFITDNKYIADNCREQWEKFEKEIAKKYNIQTDDGYYKNVYREIIIIVEKLMRALSIQFTNGKIGKKLAAFGPTYCFLQINNSFGTKKY